MTRVLFNALVALALWFAALFVVSGLIHWLGAA